MTATLPRLGDEAPPDTLPVSAFKAYLQAPYAYYLERYLRLEETDDAARELDGSAFGNLTHVVLERFGRDERARDSQDAAAIRTFLEATLDELARELYGTRPLPAVALQVEQLRLRLRAFAVHQARQRAAGWRIHAVEWEPEGGSIPFRTASGREVRLRGRIDRIDVQPERGLWAVWDYKSSDTGRKPVISHVSQAGEWRDLQLPLYSLLVQELVGETAVDLEHDPVQLGYVNLSRSDEGFGFQAAEDWHRNLDGCESSSDALYEGLQEAARIADAILDRKWFDRGAWRPYGEILPALCGVGLLQEFEDEEGEA